MKKIMGVLGVVLLTSFSSRQTEFIDGLWLGYYKSDLLKEKMIIKFSSDDHIELYTGGFDEQPRCNGSYKLVGDSVSFVYTTPEGEKYIMHGRVSRKKNYVDGIWKSNGTAAGSFFMEKQDVEEKTVQP